MDSCDSAAAYETLTASFTEDDQMVAELLNQNLLFIGTDSMIYEYPDLKPGHSILTNALLEGLAGKADINSNGTITARELEAYIYLHSLPLAVKYDRGRFHPRTVTRGTDFELGRNEVKSSQSKPNEPKETAAATRTAKLATTEAAPPVSKRTGKDYAILIGTNVYDAESWPALRNPIRDIEAIRRELIERFGYTPENVQMLRNPTKSQILDVIGACQKLKFDPDDQLFFFVAGHGAYWEEGRLEFLVCKDSPARVTEQHYSQFLEIHRFVRLINELPSQHILGVFDVCYAGKVWQPLVQILQEISFAPIRPTWSVPFERSNGLAYSHSFINSGVVAAQKSEVTRDEFILRKMKKLTRILMTSGAKPVLDDDPKASGHSPFANGFLTALKTGGGEDGVLTTLEIFSQVERLEPEPQKGKLSGSDGDFVFVVPDNLRTPSRQK